MMTDQFTLLPCLTERTDSIERSIVFCASLCISPYSLPQECLYIPGGCPGRLDHCGRDDEPRARDIGAKVDVV